MGQQTVEEAARGLADGGPELAPAVLDALRPRGLRDRLRMLLSGGCTAAQVRGRLREPGSATATQVHAALTALVADGRVHRSTARMSVHLNTKGPRDVIVDVFRR